MESQDQIQAEVDNLTSKVKESLDGAKTIAVGEAWKILQIATASIIQIIEKIGTDLKSPEKKELAMSILSKFYDKMFLVIDIPLVPNFLEPIIHKHVKSFLMLLVSSTIDALVTTFRETGIFLQKKVVNK